MRCGNCKLWCKNVPSDWLNNMPADLRQEISNMPDYGFCCAMDDVMFSDEDCIAAAEQRQIAIPLESEAKMSRSVETIGNNVIYFDWSPPDDFEDYPDVEAEDWNDLIDNIQAAVSKQFPSLGKSERWVEYPYRENRIILENDHICISITQYGCIGAFSIFTDPVLRDYWPYNTNLADHWLRQNIAKIMAIIEQHVTPLKKICTFSNGESVYEKKVR